MEGDQVREIELNTREFWREFIPNVDFCCLGIAYYLISTSVFYEIYEAIDNKINILIWEGVRNGCVF